MVGQNHMEQKDANGKAFVKEMVELAQTKGGGWVSYNWPNPATKKVQMKKTYIQRIEGLDMYVLCGVYE